MTDPRIEAAARSLFGDKIDLSDGAREYLLGEVRRTLAAADAVDPLRQGTVSIPEIRTDRPIGPVKGKRS